MFGPRTSGSELESQILSDYLMQLTKSKIDQILCFLVLRTCYYCLQQQTDQSSAY